MSQAASAIDALNQLLQIVYHSLPRYLAEAMPWAHAGDEAALAALRSISADQQEMATRLARRIEVLGGVIESGEYPMLYTDLNLVALDYLLRELAADQQQAVASIAEIVAHLERLDPQSHSLALEVLASERDHLQAIQSLAESVAARSTVSR